MLKSERYNLLEDAQSHPLTLCGKPLVGDSSGAVFWPAEKTLLVADLHLEKGSAYASRGTMLPPYDTRETLTRLAGVHRPLRAGSGHRAGRQLPRQRRRRAHVRAPTSISCACCRRIASGSG